MGTFTNGVTLPRISMLLRMRDIATQPNGASLGAAGVVADAVYLAPFMLAGSSQRRRSAPWRAAVGGKHDVARGAVTTLDSIGGGNGAVARPGAPIDKAFSSLRARDASHKCARDTGSA